MRLKPGEAVDGRKAKHGSPRRDERNGLAQLTAAPSAPASELDAQIDEAEEDDGGAEVCQRLYGEADECCYLIFATCPFYQRGATLYQSIPV